MRRGFLFVQNTTKYNTRMSTTETNGLAMDVMADLEAVSRQAARGGIVRDPELLRRIEDRAAKAHKIMLERFGLQDIGVGIIREMRGELPES